MRAPVAPPTTELHVDEIELGSPDTLSRHDIDGIFRRLRLERPISFHREHPPAGLLPGKGFWAVVRFADAQRVSRDHETFSNEPGVGIFDYPTKDSIINMDPPVHTRFRLIINRGFTPRMISRLEPLVHEQTRAIVAAVRDRGECDLVVDIAAKLPMHVICAMLGIPPSDHAEIFRLTNAYIGPSDPDYGGTVQDMIDASNGLLAYALGLAAERRANPRDDVTTTIVQAAPINERGDPDPITDQEFAEFMKLLLVGGNETTRNAIVHGVRLFQQFPKERHRFLDDPVAARSAPDEILRFSTSVNCMRRTARADAEVAGTTIKAGDKVVLWYRSANFDESVFEDPYRFDIGRTPNEHASFGAGGPHYCLGANLARLEIGSMLRAIYEGLPDLAIVGAPKRMRSLSTNGVKALPIRWRA